MQFIRIGDRSIRLDLVQVVKHHDNGAVEFFMEGVKPGSTWCEKFTGAHAAQASAIVAKYSRDPEPAEVEESTPPAPPTAPVK